MATALPGPSFSKRFPCSCSLHCGTTPSPPAFAEPKMPPLRGFPHLTPQPSHPTPPNGGDGCGPFCSAYEPGEGLWETASAPLAWRLRSPLSRLLSQWQQVYASPEISFYTAFFRCCGQKDFCLCAASSSRACTSVPMASSALPNASPCTAAHGAGASPLLWTALPFSSLPWPC